MKQLYLLLLLTLPALFMATTFSVTTSLDTSQGFIFNVNTSSGPATYTAPAGDVNGDGIDDILVGVPSLSVTYLLFGDGTTDLFAKYGSNLFYPSGTMDPSVGFKFIGVASSQFGNYVAPAGDVNNDGYDDFIINSYTLSRNYLLFGGTSTDLATKYGGTTFTISSTMDPYIGFELKGYSGGEITLSTGIGDFNGDGYGDFVIGHPAGKQALVVLGDTIANLYDKFGTTSYDYNAGFNSSLGFNYTGGSTCAIYVSAVGDFNGDGFDDFMFGCNTAVVDKPVYLIFGDSTANLLAKFGGNSYVVSATMPTTIGIKYIGLNTYATFGKPMTSAGDVNGDGFADIILGGSWTTSTALYATVYILYGDTSANLATKYGGSTLTMTSTLPTAVGFELRSSLARKWFGNGDYSNVAPVGDVNKDGFDDFLIGSYSPDLSAYLLFGDTTANLAAKLGGPSYTVQESTLPDSIGMTFKGSAGSLFGYRLSAAGDFNDDGYPDLIFETNTPGAAFLITNYCGVNQYRSAGAQVCTACSAINANCLTCANSTTCNSCSTGFDVATNCLTCLSTNPHLYNGQCYATCPAGTYANSATSCAACTSPCATCSGSATTCTSCDATQPHFYNSQCYSTCPDGTFADSSSSCAVCPSTCATCSTDGTTCTSCVKSSPYLYNGNCYQSNTCECSVCAAPCATCLGSTSTCTSCDITSPILYNGQCYSTCPTGSYADSASSCAACSSTCATCSGNSTTCTSCAASTPYLYNGSCYATYTSDCSAN